MKEPPFPVQADTCQIQQQSHCILVLREEPIFLSLWPALIYCSTPTAFCVISPAKLATECSIPASPVWPPFPLLPQGQHLSSSSSFTFSPALGKAAGEEGRVS